MKKFGAAAGAAVGFTVFVSAQLAVSPAFAQTSEAQQAKPKQNNPGATDLPALDIKTSKPKREKSVRKPIRKQRAPRAPSAAANPSPRESSESGEPSGVNTVNVSPTPGGGGLPLDKVAGSAASVGSADIARTGAAAPMAALEQRVPGVIITDVQGNEFQTDLQYRGFSASPLNGTSQGMAVYQNGVRINEVFGDTVNWDMLPTVAINDIAVVSNNPMYGLNALGGAVNVSMKDGFTYHGAEADFRVGSYGRIQESLQAGAQSGRVAGYVALEGVNDDGWRDYSASQVRRAYADLGVKNGGAEVHLNFTAAENRLGVVGPTPVELLGQRYETVYTSPQTTANQLFMSSLNGSLAVTDTLKLSGALYYRGFRQKHTDGNISDAAPCADGGGALCLDDAELVDASGNVIASPFDGNAIIGSLDRTSVKADSFGGSAQAASEAKLFGHGNHFLIGSSVDHGKAHSTANSELGVLDPNTLVVTGAGIFPSGPQGLSPVALNTTTNYYGFYISDAFDVTKELTVTAGGRYNIANIKMEDQLGTDLNGDHSYERFNPMIGATYKLLPRLTLYGGYSEANRAPTPAELSCADPERPCILEGFLVADPELKQVASHTAEAGLRGDWGAVERNGKVEWSAGLFRTMNSDDIISVAAPQQGRGYFINAGETLRQGVEASISYRTGQILLYANYAYVDATFQNDLLLSSPNSPFADADGQITVHSGDRMPSVAPHRAKAGFDYWITPKWKFGADVVATSSQYFRGDESNQNAQLPGYAVVNLHTSYEVSKNVQIYGLANNLLDHKYATFGTFYETDVLADARGVSDPRMVTPAQPFGVYGGVKIKF